VTAFGAEELVRSYLDADPCFQRRDWLEDRVQTALDDRDCRFVLVLGEPGAGKTALLARLARRYPEAARYFIRRNSRTPLNSGDAQSMLLSVGYQLAFAQPKLFDTERLEVVVRQQADRVAAGATAIGLRVEELSVSPFQRTAVSVEQQVGDVEGALVGMAVGRLVVDERVLSPSVLQYLAIIEPARLLAQDRPDAQLTLLIDALDELRFGAGNDDVLGWLAACPELPPNVRIVLSSRYDDRLLAAFRDRQRPWLREIPIESEPDRVNDDLLHYADAVLGGPVATLLRDAGVDPALFAASAVRRADGNFLYLATLLRSVDAADRAEDVLALDTLPGDLAQLYAFFLTMVREQVLRRGQVVPVGGGSVPAWEGIYQPILGLLTVAKEPLDIGSLAAALSGTATRWVHEAVDALRPFLDADALGYRLYHATLAEYLPSERARPDMRIDLTEWHAALGAAALRPLEQGLATDNPYLLRHGARHLLEAGSRTELVRLLTDLPTLQQRLRQAPDAVLADLHDAVPVAGDSTLLRQLQQAVDRQARHLRRPELVERREFLLQQLHGEATRMGFSELRTATRHRLDALAQPWWETRWISSGASEALERVIDHEGLWRVATAADCTLALTVSHIHASAQSQYTLALWNVDTGERLALFQAGYIFSAAISSDGEFAVLGTGSGRVQVLRLPHGEPVGEPYVHDPPLPREDKNHDENEDDYYEDEDEEHGAPEEDDEHADEGNVDEDEDEAVDEPKPDAVVRLAVTPNDRVAISQVWRTPIALVELSTGRLLATLDGSEYATSRFRLSPDGSTVVAGGPDGRLLAWDVPTGRPRAMDAASANDVDDVAVADHLAVGITRQDNRDVLAVWDLATGHNTRILTGPADRLSDVVLRPDGRLGAAVGSEAVHVFDATSDAPAAELGKHGDHIEAVLLLADGKIVTGGRDDLLGLWDPRRPGEGLLISGHSGQIEDLVPVPGGHRVLAVGRDHFSVWDLTKVGDADRTDHHRHAVGAVAIDPDGTVLSLANGGSEGHRWRLRDGQHVEATSIDAALSKDGRYAITGSGEPMFGQTFATVSPLSNPRRAAHTGGHRNLVLTVAVDEKRRRLVSVTDRGLVYVWPLRWRRKGWWRSRPKPRNVFGHPYWITGYAMSANGKRGVLVFEDQALVWDVDATDPLEWRPDIPVETAAVSADGTWCVLAGRGLLTLWNLDEANHVGTVDARPAAGQPDWLYCWHLAPDGSYALASDTETLLRRFEVRDGAPGGAIAVDARIVSAAASGDDVVLGTLRGDVIALRYHPTAR
jgi:WD40 repeat protein